ncbi:hypothetical protein ACP4OV_014831 [Aristida adscensionis]
MHACLLQFPFIGFLCMIEGFHHASTGVRHIIGAINVASHWVVLEYDVRKESEKVIYLPGWNSFGVAPVLDSIAQELRSIKAKKTPPELCFDRIIYIDSSARKNTREVQRKIAKSLELDPETMAMFDKQDEEDDFSGVDQGSRGVILSVAQVILQTMVVSKSIILFLNGSDSEIDFSKMGVPLEKYLNNVMIWTFKKQFLMIHHVQEAEIAEELRYTHILLSFLPHGSLYELEYNEFVHAEAAIIIARNPCLEDITLATVAECCLYEFFLHCSFHRATIDDWAAHSSNYWTCDGLIKGDTTREISNALHQEVRWVGYDSPLLEAMSEKLMKDEDTPFLVINDNTVERAIVVKRKPYRWISITSKNLKIEEGMLQTILEKASSLFVAFERSNNPHGLPNVLLKQSSNLRVLILSWCAFSFVSPPFLHCHGLRFLGLDNCKNDSTSEGGNCTNWASLYGLWVLDIRYTEWDEILDEGKMDIMANLRELNIEGFYCWQYASKLQGRLRNLERLRIIKPTHQADMSIDSNNSFIGKTKLEVLDLSGNKDMKNIPASLWLASSLQVLILDGCEGLENVVIAEGIRSTLRSFSFDGYGPAAHWTSSLKLPPESSRPNCRLDANKGDVITSKISLQGCMMLENLFVRGLPNLEELDLSESAIKEFNFKTMLVDVPGLKQLILLGCEHLHTIIWGPLRSSQPGPFYYKGIDLLCVDTRPTGNVPGFTRPSVPKYKYSQLHAILTDPRLATRSLLYLMLSEPHHDREDACFNIRITCSTEHSGDEAAGQKMFGNPRGDQQHHVLAASPYSDDVLSGIADAPMMVFPQPPTQQSDRHIEISGGSHSLESELPSVLGARIASVARSVHVHDVSTSTGFPATFWRLVEWCCVERCSNWDTVFFFPSSFTLPYFYSTSLDTIWVSDLRKARSIWREAPYACHLRHLHLRSCPMLQFVLPVSSSRGPPLPHLITLHIIHCDRLKHVFELNMGDMEESTGNSVPCVFPELATVHLHDLPSLQQICEGKMSAPALETIKVRGCFALRRLPAVAARRPGVKKPAVEVEKDVWDALEWDGLEAGHDLGLYEAPLHSRYYRRRHLMGTVLR